MILQIWDVQHGACAMLTHEADNGVQGRLAMIDSGDNGLTGWKPSSYIRHHLQRSVLDYLFITNADMDHMSDLDNLWSEGISVSAFYRNRSVPPGALRGIKEEGGVLTDDIERYLTLHSDYIHPVSAPFDQCMGGITATAFWNPYPLFHGTNNLSLAVFFKFGPFKILFPGDLEKDGWLALLDQQAFREELANTTVLVASHHGRTSGYCPRIFDYFTPQVVVVSDKSVVHSTQKPHYQYAASDLGVLVSNTNRRRRCVTTRKDGSILFKVRDDGRYTITTEYDG
ncbi:UNVERIFIED_ORG: beta-lactamase superfamily II metal-dependent hydrolase [Variovorax paradoxus]|nr:beta-lactamase superfamily II metal-dependent hydrolase [Variovorax paradoxus]